MPTAVQRRAIALTYTNAALWGAGNGLTSGSFIYYLAQELGAKGTSLSLLVAAPSLIGLLRLVTPALIGPLGGVKATCLAATTVSYLLLAFGLPAAASAVGMPREYAIAAMIGLICVHQLLEYIGTVALWSWIAAIVPQRVRGRYFGRRQIWQLALQIPAIFGAAVFIDSWKLTYKEVDPSRVLTGYLIATGIGTVFLLASIIPLSLMPAVSAPQRTTRRGLGIVRALADWRFRRLIVYRCWFSACNGLTQTAQNFYLFRLPIALLPNQGMQVGMRIGQMIVSPRFGRACDRVGNRPVLKVTQAAVAAGMLFFCFASPAARWWIAGAYLMWIAYAGLNIALTNLMLKLAPPRENAGYIAACEAFSGVAFALSTVAGGMLFDYLEHIKYRIVLGSIELNHFVVLFFAGAILRACGLFWIARIDEEVGSGR